jgi:hypothetical protein
MNKPGSAMAAVGGWAAALAIGLPLVGLHKARPVLAKPQIGKYSGSSTYWVPDYAGTIELQSSGNWSFTAIVDVELKKKPPLPVHVAYGLPPEGFEYEIRGSATIATPYVMIRRGELLYTCKVANPASVIIRDSRLMHYLGYGKEPKNSYELSFAASFGPSIVWTPRGSQSS